MDPVVEEGFQWGLMTTALVFGLRHGIDWDHIAAITDITGSQETTRKSILYSTLYALGHGVMVVVLRAVAIFAGEFLPTSVDSFMERLVGVTLIALGLYVFYSLARDGRNFRMRSRWMLLLGAARAGIQRLQQRGEPTTILIEHEHEHPIDEDHPHPPEVRAGRAAVALAHRTHRHRHVHHAPMPQDPFINYAPKTAFGIGALHGVGAETPTQVLLFVAAAGVTGKLGGFVMLFAFVIGLLISNTAIAIAGTLGFKGADRNFGVYATIAVVTAAVSLALGFLFVFGGGGALPAILAG
ncbi:MAG: hypothetical protein M3285_00555 [Actinomycetota bacterium]|nr:hypothetical protein [Actinomycetota bacterium]